MSSLNTPSGGGAPAADEPQYSLREQRGWYVYDWANSVFATSAITLFLPTYIPALAAAAAFNGITAQTTPSSRVMVT